MDQLAEAPARNHAPRNPLVVPDLLGVVLVFLDCSSLGRTAIAIKAAFRVLFGALADGRRLTTTITTTPCTKNALLQKRSFSNTDSSSA